MVVEDEELLARVLHDVSAEVMYQEGNVGGPSVAVPAWQAE